MARFGQVGDKAFFGQVRDQVGKVKDYVGQGQQGQMLDNISNIKEKKFHVYVLGKFLSENKLKIFCKSFLHNSTNMLCKHWMD